MLLFNIFNNFSSTKNVNLDWLRKLIIVFGVIWTALIIITFVFPFLVARGLRENILIWPVCLAIGIALPYVKEIEFIFLKRFASSVAKYSYGIYLIHGPWIAFSFFYLDELAKFTQWCIFFIGVSVLSVAAYNLIESPFVKMGVRISRHKTIADVPAQGNRCD